MTLTPEFRLAAEEAGEEPVRVKDPETHTAYGVIKEDRYRTLSGAIPVNDSALHEFEELIPLE